MGSKLPNINCKQFDIQTGLCNIKPKRSYLFGLIKVRQACSEVDRYRGKIKERCDIREPYSHHPWWTLHNLKKTWNKKVPK